MRPTAHGAPEAQVPMKALPPRGPTPRLSPYNLAPPTQTPLHPLLDCRPKARLHRGLYFVHCIYYAPINIGRFIGGDITSVTTVDIDCYLCNDW